jgi:hypothetical protein
MPSLPEKVLIEAFRRGPWSMAERLSFRPSWAARTEPAGTGAGRGRASGWSGADRWALAELFALTGLAITQPVLDVTGRSPDMFLFRRADRLDILLLVAVTGLFTLLAAEVVKATTDPRGPRRSCRRW